MNMGSEITTLKPADVAPNKPWTGRVFPDTTHVSGDISYLSDDKHGIVMGVSDVNCDDAQTNLQRDWDLSPVNYTCYNPKQPLPVQELQSLTKCTQIPENYSPQHICMSDPIFYDSSLPTYGNHRPLWPTFGEYMFVPPQRWLHNIEHGAVVMLYHPCAEPILVQHLRKLVTKCLRKHIITPSIQLSHMRPLALVAWGCSMEMSTVISTDVVKFIKEHALKGPEGKIPKQGTYNLGLVTTAKIVDGSDEKDSNLCPF